MGQDQSAADPASDAIAEAMAIEQNVFDSRRQLFEKAGVVAPARKVPQVGLALSGGGIRSATFSLGFVQALSRHGHIPSIDYLSTVSGGSYFGSFFGAMFIDPALRQSGDAAADGSAAPSPHPPADLLRNPLGSVIGRRAATQLSEFGRYLAPGGPNDVLLGVAISLRNWAAVHLVLGLVPLALFLAIDLASRWWTTGKTASAVGADEVFAELVGAGAAVVLAIGAAYWFTRRERVPSARVHRLATNWMLAGALALSLFMLFPWLAERWDPERHWPAMMQPWLGLWLLGAVAIYMLAELRTGRVAAAANLGSDQSLADSALDAEDRVRAYLSRWLTLAVGITATLFALYVLWLIAGSTAGMIRAASEHAEELTEAFAYVGLWSWLAEVARRFWPAAALLAPGVCTIWAHAILQRRVGGGRMPRPAMLMALGLAILSMWVMVWATIARLVGGLHADVIDGTSRTALVAFAFVVAAILAVSAARGFLNLSSLSTLYAARLKRAFIGASNPDRRLVGYNLDRAGDHVPMPVYYGGKAQPSGVEKGAGPRTMQSWGGPIHLINVTIAETRPDASNVTAHDRRGKPMHVGPAGCVFQSARPGQFARLDFAQAEPLPLSTWTAISGAAASTAIGKQTSLGFSVLAMMANVRLGYWWRAHRSLGGWWRVLPTSFSDSVFGYLFDELRGRFTAGRSSKRWHLTDGGHFDNSGIYPLLQRRLPFIIASDNGADPGYRLQDVFQLLQRAETDLGVRILFMREERMRRLLGADSPLLAWTAELKLMATRPAEESEAPPAYATFARIFYPERDNQPATTGLLMLIKPRLSFSEPAALLAYRRTREGAGFPQQTTGDQFFDESQWQAYRQFGEWIGDRLFAKVPGSDWSPASMAPPPLERLGAAPAQAEVVGKSGGH